jgi:hypothetical protein
MRPFFWRITLGTLVTVAIAVAFPPQVRTPKAADSE